MENNPISDGRKKTGAYVGENRKLDAGFRVKGIREFAESNASSPTVQLQSLRMCLSVIAYRKWNSRAMNVSRAFVRSGPLELDTYAQLPRGVEKGNISWKLLKPVYGLRAAGKDRGGNIRNIAAKECGGKQLL